MCKKFGICSKQRIKFHLQEVIPVSVITYTLFILSLRILIVTECADVDIPYCYDEPDCDPHAWGQYFPECQDGNFQSPINLEKARAKKVAKSVNLVLSKEYAYIQSPFLLHNNGHSVELTLSNEVTSRCLVKGKGFLPNEPFTFLSLHFHWGEDDSIGSEHTIGGRAFPLELHMIHTQVRDPNKLAVFGILYQISENDNPALTPITDNLNRIQKYNTSTLISAGYAVNLTQLLPRKVKVFRYQGSLTTPPCSEGVVWTVFDDIQSVSSRQLMAFRSLRRKKGTPLTKNYRPIQSTYTSQRKNIYYMKSILPNAKNANRKRQYG